MKTADIILHPGTVYYFVDYYENQPVVNFHTVQGGFNSDVDSLTERHLLRGNIFGSVTEVEKAINGLV